MQLKSEISGGYLQAVDFQINSQGQKTTIYSTFVVTKIKEGTLALKTHDSRKIVSSSATAYTLVDNMDETYPDNTQFVVKWLGDQKISLQSHESFYLSSDVNGFISQHMDSLDSFVTPHEMWTFRCFEGKYLYSYVSLCKNNT